MEQHQGPAAPQPFDPNQYDFITNPETPPKKKLIPKISGSGGDKSSLLVKIVAGLAIVTILILVGSIIFGGKGANRDQLLSVARTQSSILALTKIGTTKAGSTDTKSLANSVAITLQSDQNAIIEQLGKSGKVKAQEYAGVASATTAQTLTVAEQNGTFDVAFESTIKEELASYQAKLQSAHDSTDAKALKAVLAQAFDNTSLLIKDAENNK